MKSLRIVFMGTPDFAVASLSVLHESKHNIVGVVTVPDKASGRGQKLKPSPVKQYALDHELPVLQPPKLKADDFHQALAELQADLFVVVAFRMLPEVVWSMPELGTINLHGSLLPNYRGAAPIHWAVINGETETGVTTFFIEKEIDTGDMIQQKSMAIGPDETTGEIHDRMMELGAGVLLETVDKIALGSAKAQKQDDVLDSDRKPAPKLFKSDCIIPWDKTAQEVHNFIRGLNPFPGAWTMWDEQIIKVHRSRLTDQSSSESPGKVRIEKNTLFVSCDDQWLEVIELQVQGKRKMKTDVFLNGIDSSKLDKHILQS